jgi:hypothetical protein
MKLNKLIKIIVAVVVFIASLLLIVNAYNNYTVHPTIHSAIGCWIQIFALAPALCLSFQYLFKCLYRVVKHTYIRIKKKYGTDEVSKIFKLKTHFDIDEFPETYYKVFNNDGEFIGYLVEKK